MRKSVAFLFLAVGASLVLWGFGIVASAEIGQQEIQNEWAAPKSISVVDARKENPTGLIARLEFKRLQREVFVLDGREPSNLKRGPVWLRESAPLGSGGNTVVAGHRDTHFRFLKDIAIGDRIGVEHGERQGEFRVSGIHIVTPDERRLLAPVKRDVITFVTCYPFHTVGRAKKRMIVTAERVSDMLASPKIQ